MAVRSVSSNTGNTNSPSVPVPAGAAANDIVIIALDFDLTGQTITWPSGFTQLGSDTTSFDGQQMGIAWKRLTGSDTGSYSPSWGAAAAPWCMGAVCLSGRDTSNAPAVGATGKSNVGNSSPVSVDAPTVTAVAGDDLVQVSLPDVNTSGGGAGFTAPSGYTEQVDVTITFSNLGMFTKENVGAGATGTVSSSFALSAGTSAWVAWLVRVPSAGGGTDATVTAVPADAVADVPNPGVQAGSTVSAAPADAVGAVPPPSVSGGGSATVTAPACASVGRVVAPAVAAGSTVVAVAADATGDVPLAVAAISVEVVTGPASGVGDVPAPLVQAGGDATVAAAAADATGDVPAPSVGAGATVTAVSADATGDVPAPSVGAGAEVAAAPADALADVVAPGVTGDTVVEDAPVGLPLRWNS